MGKLEQKVQETMNSLDHFCNKYILTTTHHPPKNINRHGSVQDFIYANKNRVNQHAWRLHTLGDEEMFPESGVPQGTGDPENLVQKIQTVILDTVELTVPRLKHKLLPSLLCLVICLCILGETT